VLNNMKSTWQQTTGQTDFATLHLKKSLLPIDEYARRRGLSTDKVENFGRLGIVKIRKYRGKTFVVDVPVSPYVDGGENKQAEEFDSAAQSQKIAELVRKVGSDKTGVSESKTKPSGPVEAWPIVKSHRADTRRHSNVVVPEAASPLKEFQLRILSGQARLARNWRIAATFLFACIFALGLFSLGLYLDRQIQIQKVDSTYATLRSVHDDFLEANSRLEELQSRLDFYGLQLNRTKTRLRESAARIKQLRDNLAAARREVYFVRSESSKTIRRLNEQIMEMTVQLSGYKNKLPSSFEPANQNPQSIR